MSWNWIKASDKLPECWSQHNTNYASGYLLTCDTGGEIQVNQLWMIGKVNKNGLMVSQKLQWETDVDVEYWCYIEYPK